MRGRRHINVIIIVIIYARTTLARTGCTQGAGKVYVWTAAAIATDDDNIYLICNYRWYIYIKHETNTCARYVDVRYSLMVGRKSTRTVISSLAYIFDIFILDSSRALVLAAEAAATGHFRRNANVNIVSLFDHNNIIYPLTGANNTILRLDGKAEVCLGILSHSPR